jgi:hypothetical protein
MADTLEIIEIIDRTRQGVTRPFLCRCEDNRQYFVKGRGAGKRSLLCEWLAAHLATGLGLPVPEFRLVRASQGLIELFPEGYDLGAEIGFGSLQVEMADEFTLSHREAVPTCLRDDLLLFDLWIRNQDRTLTSISGNPNLLWGPNGMSVIDHNVAFDRDFDFWEFSQGHVFRDGLARIREDGAVRRLYIGRLLAAAQAWEQGIADAPPDWWHFDSERTIATDFDVAEVRDSLQRCASDEFWGV